MARYSNRYILDITIAAWLFLFGTGLFLIYTVLYGDYESYCVDFLCASEYIYLASLLAFFAGTLWFVHLSYPEQMEAEMISIFKYFDVKDFNEVDFGNRYVYGCNFCLLGWFFLFATLPLIIIPIWGYDVGYYSINEFLLYFFLYLLFILFSIFFVVITFPESMVSNNGRGTSYIYNTLFYCFLGPLYNEDVSDYKYPDTTVTGFFQKHCGSDFLFSVWLFFILSIVQLIYVIYGMFVYDDKYVWINFIASVFLAVGSGLFVYTSYPNSFFSRYWWCSMTFQKDEVLEYGPEMTSIMNAMMGQSPEETKPLV